MCTGGGVGFTRLFHASANEALEILIPWHRQFSFGHTTTLSPAVRHGDAKDRRNQSGSIPPFASHRTPAGAESQEVGRGSPPPTSCWIPVSASSTGVGSTCRECRLLARSSVGELRPVSCRALEFGRLVVRIRLAW